MSRFLPLLLVVTSGCAASLARNPHNIVLTSAVIGPSTQAGERWDGVGSVPPELRAAALAAVAEMDPQVGLVVKDLQALNASLEPPDTAGQLEFSNQYPDDQRRVPIAEAPDTYTPSWASAPPTVVGVRITRESVLRVQLEDIDTRFDAPDVLGTLVLDQPTLVSAWRARKPYAVDVAGQSGGQVLTLTIEVQTP